MQAPSVLCKDLNSGQHNIPTCALDNGCPELGTSRQDIRLCSHQDCRNCYDTIPTLLFCHSATAPPPHFESQSFLFVIPVVKGGKEEGADSIHRHGHDYCLCPGLFFSCPTAFHMLSCDIRALGLQMTSLRTGTGLAEKASECWRWRQHSVFSTVSSLAALLLKWVRKKRLTMSCCVHFLCSWDTLFTLTQKTVIKGYKSQVQAGCTLEAVLGYFERGLNC